MRNVYIALIFVSTCLVGLSLSWSASAQSKNIPLPMYPASFEESVYNRQKGCVPSNDKIVFAVMENEGMLYYGRHPKMDTPQTGLHFLDLMYSPDKNYGYTMSNIGNGMECVTRKLRNFKFRGNVVTLRSTESQNIKREDCAFEPPMLTLCGTFEQLSARLIKAGYTYDWQAKDEQDNTITMLSGTGQSWMLTTHKKTGATIFTGAGKGEFEFLNEKVRK